MNITEILDELRQEREQITNAVNALQNLARGRETKKVLDDLVKECHLVEDAVVALENLARGRGKRRGRRPAWINEVKEARKSRTSA